MNRRGFFGRVAAAAAVAVAGKAVQAAGKVEEAVKTLEPAVTPPAPLTPAPTWKEYGQSFTVTDEWLNDNPGDIYRARYRYLNLSSAALTVTYGGYWDASTHATVVVDGPCSSTWEGE